ncbi:helix-turn-helix domain-containing protein [Roseovarius sp. D22-M7]|uniref:helix-turn-helix domain-containing protein n=1 Tax=Roseovarius sp. D22-M7 TaxID=3127116 RepID=UPI0030104FD4
MSQNFYSVAEVARKFRRHPRTIRDWILKGCPTPGGSVKLPATKLGKEWCVTEEQLALFEVRARSSSCGRPDLDLNGA